MIFLALLAATVVCTGRAAQRRPRLRKELRNLKPAEYRLFVQGLATMQSVPTAAGQEIFGPLYKDATYFTLKHIVAVQDIKGDQGHYGPCFMTFHRAFLLEFENALLSVVPGLPGLPYWDSSLDAPGGRYYNTSKYIFSTRYAGNKTGDPTRNYTVTTGAFGWKLTSKYDPTRYPQFAPYVNLSSTGFLRSNTNQLANPYITRNPTTIIKPLIEGNVGIFGGFNMNPNYADAMKSSAAAGTLMSFSQADWNACLDVKRVSTWAQWTMCVDLSAVFSANNVTEAVEYISSFGTLSALMHAAPHFLTGGFLDPALPGDFADVGTSPNEIMLFPMHHANLDRSVMDWQAKAQKANPKLATKGVMWNYPASHVEAPNVVLGCLLNDVINGNGSFTDIFAKTKETGFTHFDVLDKTRPGTGPYSYKKP